jgi:hypothetical protein
MINEIELWEQEIEDNEKKKEALKEASIYNFYDGEVVQEIASETISFMIGAGAWIGIPIALTVAADKVVQHRYKKAFTNYEEQHKDDKDFIKASEFDTKVYNLKLMSDEIDKPHKPSNAFEKFIDKNLSKDKKAKLFPGFYDGKALCFLKDGEVYFYLIYKLDEGYDVAANFFATSDIAKKHKEYYMVYACRKLNFEDDKTKRWAKAYKK